jgi:rhomboid family GlyGly-CTERM serine protease
MGLHEDDHSAQKALRHWAVPVVIAIVAAVFELGGKPVRELLAFDRNGIAAGEAWRLLSGHFVHLGISHLALNLVGLALVWYLVGRHFTTVRWLIVTILSIVAMDAGFWWLNPELDWYVGLSGLLHGLLAAGLVVAVRERDREGLVIALFVIGKLAWEQWGGPLPGSETTAGGAVIVDAHLYGAIGGALAGIVAGFTGRRVRPI